MKTRLIISLSTLAVTAAYLVSHAGTAASGIAFVAVGVLAILHSDYGRKVEPLRARASVISIGETRGRQPELRAAA